MKLGIIGCGYVGQAMALYWKAKGYQVSVTTRRRDRIETLETIADRVYLIGDDLSDFLQDQDAILISVAPDSGQGYLETYVGTVEKVIRSLSNAPQLRQIIYLSSTSVYGDHQGAIVDETTPVSPLNENGKILCLAEQKLLNAQIKTCLLRLGEIIGPGRLIEDRLRKSFGQIFSGDGSQITNIIHLDDIVRAIDFVVEHQLEGIFNLCSDYHETRKYLYDELCEKANLPPVKWGGGMSAHGGNKCVSNSKIKGQGFLFENT